MGKKLPQDIGAFFDAHCTMLLPVQFCNLNFCILDLPPIFFVLCFCNKLCLFLYFATNFVCILFLQQTLFVSCFCNKLCCILYFQETLFVFCFSSSKNDSRSRASQFRSHSLTFSKLKWCFAKFFQRDVGHRNILIESKHLLKPH